MNSNWLLHRLIVQGFLQETSSCFYWWKEKNEGFWYLLTEDDKADSKVNYKLVWVQVWFTLFINHYVNVLHYNDNIVRDIIKKCIARLINKYIGKKCLPAFQSKQSRNIMYTNRDDILWPHSVGHQELDRISALPVCWLYDKHACLSEQI